MSGRPGTARAVAFAAVLVPVLVGCGAERVCPAVGWSNTLVVELDPAWPELDGAAVRVAGGYSGAAPLTGRSAEVQLDMSVPDTVVVTVLDARGAVLTDAETEPEWRRVGGTAECGGPAEATVVVDR